MVLLTTTPQILDIISSLPPAAIANLSRPTKSTTTNASTTAPSDTSTSESQPLPTSLSSPISHITLVALSRLRQHHDNNHTTIAIPPLNTLLRGTRPYHPPPPPKPTPTPEYTALMARLRQEQETREYAAMIAKRSSPLTFTGADAEEEDNISPSLVLNILLSIVMCAIAMFQITKWWANDGVRVLMSLGTGLVVGIAEVGVYSIYLIKVKTAKEKERRKREKKSLIGEYLPEEELREAEEEGEEGAVVKVVEEKEEIWGRGVNGGMRRRIREKWEKEQARSEE